MRLTDDIFVVKAKTDAEKAACLDIRQRVFSGEQNVPVERDRDGYDDKSLHYLALKGSQPIGTARVQIKDNGAIAKIERVAVLPEARGLKIGKKIMQAIEADEELSGVDTFLLQAQSYVIPFYESLGYVAFGEEVMDVGIPHRNMSKPNPGTPAMKAG